MSEKLKSFEEYLLGWLRTNCRFFCMNLAFGIIVYFMIISESLVNSMDGIWHPSTYNAGNWEASLGRFLLRYLDYMRNGSGSVSLNSILTLSIISLASILIMNLFEIKSTIVRLLLSGLLIANPVTCITLSYSFTSVGYGMAFLFAAVAVCCINRKNMFFSIFAGGCCIAAMMGCYQAYFGVVCYLLLLLLIRLLIQNRDRRELAIFAVKSVLSIVMGGGLYIAASSFFLKKEGIQLADYRGASGISLSKILTSLPETLCSCYKIFFDFFLNRNMYLLKPHITPGFITAIQFLLTACTAGTIIFSIIYQFIRIIRKNRTYGLAFLPAVCAAPVMCCAIILIVGGQSIDLLMSMCLVIFLPMFVVIVPRDGKTGFWMGRIYYILMAVLLWKNILTVSNDQLALSEGRRSTVNLIESVADHLTAEGYLTEDSVIALVGNPADNPSFVQLGAFHSANYYARFGAFWSFHSWGATMYTYCHIRLPLCSEEQLTELQKREDVKLMSTFPAKGSIQEIDGVIVVKLSP